MSRYNQRHCHHCWQLGHNIRTCPKMIADATANPQSYAAVKLSRVQEKNKTSTRGCSYCHQQGHNKKTCMKLRTDYVKSITENSQFRKHVLEKFNEYGIGVGCMFEWSYSQYSEPDRTMLIESIEWNNILVRNGTAALIVLVDGERESYYDIQVSDNFLSRVGSQYKIVVPAPNPALSMPTDWLNGRSNIKKVFPDYEG